MSAELDFDPFAGPALALSTPSTESQREVWTATRMGDDASCAFNESCSLSLRGQLDVERLRGAVADLVRRHEALRTTFSLDGTVLCVAGSLTVSVPLVELAGLPAAEQKTELARLLSDEVEKPFPLGTGPLVRLRLVKLADDQHLLVFTAHHIVCDGFSTAVLMRDLAALYTARRRGVPAVLAPAFPFSRYARETSELERTPRYAEAERYWVERFSGSLPVLDLPFDRPRPRVKSYPSARHDHRIGPELVLALKKAGARAGASFFGTLLSVLEVLLHRLSGQDDLVVGIPAAGQIASGQPQLVGHCVNTLPIRVQLDGDQPFTALLRRVRSALLDAQDHQYYTLGSLLRALAIPRDPSRLPLVSVLFNLDQGLADDALAFDGLEASFRALPRHFENFDLFVNAVELRGEVVFECQFNTDLLDERTVRRWFESLDRILREVVARPELPIDRIPILPPGDEELQADCNDTRREYPRNRLLHQLVEHQVDRTPDAVAVVSGTEALTYRELDRRANQLAHHLRAVGAGPEVLVGLSLERSPGMLVAMLAVHKAGAAYVPLDPSFPAERLAFMVADSGMPVILTQRSLRPALPPHHAKVIEIDGDGDAIARQPVARPAPTGHPDGLAYVLYTSGSTGRPKGVQVPVAAVVNFLWSVSAEPGLAAGDRLVAVTTLSFDIAVLELWLPLIVGSRIVLASREVAGDGPQLRRLIEGAEATVMQATPSTWRLLVDAGWEGGPRFKAICGGEALPVELAGQLVERATVWNMYGPTETTVWSTCRRLSRSPGQVLIGRPIANTQIHVLDRLQQPVPVGVPGELYIGGDGVARGYLNRPELTAERFVADPWRGEPTARLYRTGDMVRLRPDGELEFLGRNDSQVKVRGFRVELGEVEASLARHPSVRQAVAMAREDRKGDVRLVAYTVLQPGLTAPEEELREHLRRLLPEYMVPQHLVQLEELPLTPNGKIDRKALPAPEVGARCEEYVPPRDEAERLLAVLWQDALGIARVGIHDDFFRLGGHSLLAAQIITRLSRDHGVTLPMRKIFESPTVAQFATLLASARTVATIPRRKGDGPAPVSFMQERVWNLEQLQPGRAVFNLPWAFRLQGRLDVAALERAFTAFFQRHESTRTTLHPQGDSVAQVVSPETHLSLRLTDLSALAPEMREQELMKTLLTESAEPFDLTKGPLVRVRLFRLEQEEHVVFFMPHHAIWDGWSFEILVRDMSALYDAFSHGREVALPSLPISYRDFAAWHREWLRSPEVEKQAGYWRQHLGGKIPPLDLPIDRPRPRVVDDAGATLWVEIPRAEADALTALGQEHGATLFMVMLAAYETLLHRYSGQDDILVGTPVRGRAQPETEDMAGTFINTLVLRTSFAGSPTFVDLLSRTRNVVREAFAHDDVPFEHLAMSHEPIFRAFFSFQDTRARSARFGDLAMSHVHLLPPVAASDVSLWVIEEDSGLVSGLNYSTELFDAATMERFLACFRRLLRGVLANPAQPVSKLVIVSETERAGFTTESTGAPLLHESFERQATLTPEALALVDDGDALSYHEVRHRAAALAGRLRAAGVGPEVRVGLWATLSADSVIGALAIAQAGGVCVPLDPEDPVERLGRLLADARPKVILASSGLRHTLPEVAAEVIAIEDAPGSGARPEPGSSPARPESTAAVLYVSDPRGELVGVAIPYRALAAAVEGVRRVAEIGAADVLLATGSSASGCGILEPWLALVGGGKAVLDGEALGDVERLRVALERSRANVLHAPAWIWQRLLEARWSGGPEFKVLCGEPPPPGLARELPARAGGAFALYGSAEIGVWAGAGRLDPGPAPSLIGRPWPGVRWRVVDANVQPVPLGVPGELLVGGEVMARASGGHPERMADRFVADPSSDPQCSRWYRTGDRVRLRPDGRVELLGRMDDRLCIRGQRVEPAEIERALERHPAVQHAAVAAHCDSFGEARLVAYVVRRAGGDYTGSELRSHLRGLLPKHMVPRHFIELDALPIASGRLDRGRLPTPFHDADLRSKQVPPRTEAEKLLASLWQDALALPHVSIHDNLFDLGGHSLLCLQMVAQIEKRTGKRLSPRVLLLNTLEQVAGQLPSDGLAGAASSDPVGQAATAHS